MPRVPLPDFEGLTVGKSTVRITNAGDGLSEALSLAPRAYHVDDEIHLVVRCRITQVNHRMPADETEDLVRVHTAKALEATEVGAGDVAELLASARDRVRKAKEEATGQSNLLDEAAASWGPAGLGPDAVFNPDDLPEDPIDAALPRRSSAAPAAKEAQ